VAQTRGLLQILLTHRRYVRKRSWAAVPLQRAAAVCPRCVTRSGLFRGNLMNIR